MPPCAHPTVHQNDVDGDGDTDEGAILTQNRGAKISDVNGDNFFDGPVRSALIAVNASCGSPTEKPVDPPTPNPATPRAAFVGIELTATLTATWVDFEVRGESS